MGTPDEYKKADISEKAQQAAARTLDNVSKRLAEEARDEAADATPMPPVRIEFQPKLDKVLIQMDTRGRAFSKKIFVPGEEGYKVIASGVIIAVGEGVYLNGHGFLGSRFKPGDHVAVNIKGDHNEVPLSNVDMEHFFVFSESDVLGVIAPGADCSSDISPWYNPKIKRVVVG